MFYSFLTVYSSADGRAALSVTVWQTTKYCKECW